MNKFRFISLAYSEKASALLAALWFMLFWLVACLMVSRYFLHGQLADSLNGGGWQFWLTGLRFDAQAAACLLLPVFGLGLFFCAGQAAWRFFLRLGRLMFALAGLLAALAAIGNYYFYQLSGTFIDSSVFKLLEQEQGDFWTDLWNNYPVIPVGLVILLLTLLPAWLGGRILRSPLAGSRKNLLRINSGPRRRGGGALFWFALIFTGLVLILMTRGNLETPLGRADAVISENATLNRLTPNGLTALHWAWQDYRNGGAPGMPGLTAQPEASGQAESPAENQVESNLPAGEALTE